MQPVWPASRRACRGRSPRRSRCRGTPLLDAGPAGSHPARGRGREQSPPFGQRDATCSTIGTWIAPVAGVGIQQPGGNEIMRKIGPNFTRRHLLAGAGTGAAMAITGFPAIVRAQAKEIVVGGAANFTPWMNGTVAQAFEAKYKTKLIYEGTKSLVNLEKMQKNKDKQYLSVVHDGRPGDDPRGQGRRPREADAGVGAQPRQGAARRDSHGRHVGQLPAALAGHRLQREGAPRRRADLGRDLYAPSSRAG